jgi:hypothetical protein
MPRPRPERAAAGRSGQAQGWRFSSLLRWAVGGREILDDGFLVLRLMGAPKTLTIFVTSACRCLASPPGWRIGRRAERLPENAWSSRLPAQYSFIPLSQMTLRSASREKGER